MLDSVRMRTDLYRSHGVSQFKEIASVEITSVNYFCQSLKKLPL